MARHVAVSAACLLIPAFTFLLWLSIRDTASSLPLKSPFSQLDVGRLSPFTHVARDAIDRSVVDALGTEQCAHWTLREPGPGGRHLSLFVAYYTDSFNAALETPMANYGAFSMVDFSTGGTILTSSDSKAVTIGYTVRVYQDASRGRATKWVAIEALRANGTFYSSKDELRRELKRSKSRCTYLTRVVASTVVDSQTSQDDAIASLKRLLGVAIPILMEDHWPQ